MQSQGIKPSQIEAVVEEELLRGPLGHDALERIAAASQGSEEDDHAVFVAALTKRARSLIALDKLRMGPDIVFKSQCEALGVGLGELPGDITTSLGKSAAELKNAPIALFDNLAQIGFSLLMLMIVGAIAVACWPRH